MRARTFERLVRAAAARPILTVAIVLALAVGGGVLALGLRPSAGIDTFVGPGSASYRATVDDERHFGDQAVIILIHESLPDLVETKDLGTLSQLEACLAGQYVAANAQLRAFTPVAHAPYGGWRSPCGRLMRSRATQVVYGPGTFLNRAVAAVNTQIRAMTGQVTVADQKVEAEAFAAGRAEGMSRQKALAAAAAAGRLEYQSQIQKLETMAVESGLNGVPSIDDPNFIPSIVFDSTRGVNMPKARFAYLFPGKYAALIQVRLRSSLSDAQQAQAISWIRQAIRMPMFRSAYGGTYTVTGVPVVTDDLAAQITRAIVGLLVAAVVVMAVVLLAVFRARLRLLPLGIALAAAGITFGLLAVLGASLTLASVAVLPILIGLAVDYGVQFQARAEEARRGEAVGAAGGAGGLGGAAAGGAAGAVGGAAESVARAAGRAAPAIATAALATATGFIVLLLSPVPMVRGFGVLLVVGIAVAFGCALTAGSAALVIAERRLRGRLHRRGRGGAGAVGTFGRVGRVGAWVGWAGAWAGASLRGAGEIVGLALAAARAPLRGRAAVRAPLRGRRLRGGRRIGSGRSLPPRVLAGGLSRPGRVVALAAVLAVLGWVADTRTQVQSDVTKLVPASMPALRHLGTLERVTGVSGEIDVTVRARDVATPRIVGWMVGFENRLLRHYGYLEETGCARATLCPALSLPDLFSTSAPAGLTQGNINGLLAAVPPYFSQAVITSDRHEATLAFGLRLMPLLRQERVIAYMRSHLHPPPGVSAELAGLPVLAADANASLSSTLHRFLTLVAGLVAVAVVLLIVLRRPGRALVPMIPILLATGWSSLVLYLIGIPLNPMSATLGTLVIAISTEFSVLLSERCRQERAGGQALPAALQRTYRSTGVAVLASGVTAIAGFGVLMLSDITMLRDFGFVTVIDLAVSLVGVLLVLPAVMALAERGEVLERLRPGARGASRALMRLRRRPRMA